VALRTAEEAARLRAITFKKYKWMDYKWDLMFWITALPVVAAACDITKLLFAGDWDFWTDWKDRQWWMTITPFAMIIIPSALSYIQWLAWRMATGFTYTAVGLWIVSWFGRWLQWDYFTHYPMSFVWPATIIPAAILTDYVMLKTKSFVLTSVIGAFVFTIAFWAANYVTLAPYLQPVLWNGHVLSVADVQGIEYLRSATPEYLRIIEHGSLRTFLGETTLVAIVFGATFSCAGYWIGQFIGRYIAVWPIGKFLKNV
jgi:methane/ammonia monooxygenase subunit A